MNTLDEIGLLEIFWRIVEIPDAYPRDLKSFQDTAKTMESLIVGTSHADGRMSMRQHKDQRIGLKVNDYR